MTIRELAQEAHEIIVNTKRAYDAGEITRQQRDEVIAAVIRDVAYQMEYIPQLRAGTGAESRTE
jgi:hypothetical protein